MLAEVFLPDPLAEEVIIEDVHVGEEVLDVFRLYLARRLSELLEEARFGLRLRFCISLQCRVHFVQSLQLLEGYRGLDRLLGELQQLAEVVEIGLKVVSQGQHGGRDVQRLLAAFGRLQQMHRVDVARSENVVAQFHQVLNVGDHVVSARRVDVRHETVLLDEVARQHVPQPPELVRHYLCLREMVRRAQPLKLVLELFDLLQKLVDVPTRLRPPVDTAPFVAVRNVSNYVLNRLSNQRKLLLQCLIWVDGLSLLAIFMVFSILRLPHR